MTKWIVLLFSAAVLVAAEPEKEVMATMEAYKQATMKKDVAAMSRILADDLTYTHSSNLHQDKAAVLAALKNSKTVVDSMDFKDLKIRIYGQSAVVTCDIESKSNGTLSRLHVLHVLVKGPQGWQIVARQATRPPEVK
jgi:ketosteroid isomerase-like protein